MLSSYRIDAKAVKQLASGRWKEILQTIGGIDPAVLDGKHHPCPKCGGRDRFRMINIDAGAVFCNQCFSQKNGDGLAALQWMIGKDFSAVVQSVADYLRIVPNNGQKPESRRNGKDDPAKLLDFRTWNDETERIAERWTGHKRGITTEAIKASGGKVATYRRDFTVIALPVFGSEFDTVGPVGWILWNAEPPIDGDPNSGKLPTFSRNPETDQYEIDGWKKVLLSPGSRKGLIGLHGLQQAKSATTVIVVEGPTDLLALWSSMSEDERESFSVLSTSNGAKCHLEDWMLDLLAEKDIFVVYDCDNSGSEGVENHYQSLKPKASLVRVLKLPYPDGSKKDVRDFLNDGNSFANVMALEQVEMPSVEPVADDEQKRETVISNGYATETQDEKGKPKTIVVPLPMSEILELIKESTDNWPRRAGERLFVPSKESTVDLFERSNEFFGWLGSKNGKPSKFYTGPGFHKETEVFSEFKRTAKTYRHIETIPHWPPYEDHYYCCQIPESGNGQKFDELIDRYSPATPCDSDLIKVLFATAFAGLSGGERPAFCIGSDDGRGAGKTTLVSHVGLLAGGMIDISPNEDIDCVKKRLLSRDGVTRRVVCLDNLKSYRFSWGEFESLITSLEISGWLLHIGNGSRPNNLLWTITQNGIGLSTDMAQRCVIIKLEKPEYSGDWAAETRNFILDNRDEIIADIIGFLRAEKKPLARRSRWGSWESLVLAGLSNPEPVQRLIVDRQKEADSELDESAITEDYFREQIESATYNTDTEVIFIPSQLAANWYNKALTERQKTVSVSRLLRQAIREGKFCNIQETSERRIVRGFLWVGRNADTDEPVSYDLETRIEELNKNYQSNRF